MNTYTEAASQLIHKTSGNAMTSRKVANNTYLIRRSADDIAVRLHTTDVVTYHSDGTITLDTGGWQSYTTKERLNRFTPFSVGAIAGVWYVTRRNPQYMSDQSQPWSAWTVPFWDGMRIDPDATTPPAVPESEALKSAADKETLRLIGAYVRGLSDVWPNIIADAVAHGTAGDCLICQMGGDMAASDSSHLFAHLRERYYMATLALNALAEVGYREPMALVNHVDIVKRAVRRYFRAHCLIGNATGRKPSAAHAANW